MCRILRWWRHLTLKFWKIPGTSEIIMREFFILARVFNLINFLSWEKFYLIIFSLDEKILTFSRTQQVFLSHIKKFTQKFRGAGCKSTFASSLIAWGKLHFNAHIYTLTDLMISNAANATQKNWWALEKIARITSANFIVLKVEVYWIFLRQNFLTFSSEVKVTSGQGCCKRF
jgi:hypothetical protein